MKKVLKIANSQAFWGDQQDASARLLAQQPDLDFLTLDYLSEVSLSIMASQRTKDPSSGYAKDFVDVVKSLIPSWEFGSKVKIVTNAGGLEPKKCAEACLTALQACKKRSLSVAVIYGDDVLDVIKSHPDMPSFHHLETGEAITTVLDRLTTANAYLGAQPIAEALAKGADIVVTGRVADPSLTVGPCIFHFGWDCKDYDKIAQATVAGHLIECGTQVTGGIATDWLSVNDPANLGFPFVEIDETGTFIITKPEKTGGSVILPHVKEQLLYEIGDPSTYLSPDATVSFLSLVLKQVGENRVVVSGAQGRAPSSSYKVSATYRDGYRAEGTLAIFGRQCREKARRAGEMILERMRQSGFIPKKSLIECIGGGDVVPGIHGLQNEIKEPLECLLRVSVADPRLEVLEYFSKQIAPLVTCGPQGTTGYISGRPHIRSVFGYWPCLIERTQITPKIELLKGVP